jgi:hypothetical protein
MTYKPTYKKNAKIAMGLDKQIIDDISCEKNTDGLISTDDKQEILTNTYKKTAKNAKNANDQKNIEFEKIKKYECKICLFSTYNKYNYSSHLSTKKHIKNCSNMLDTSNNLFELSFSNQCICGKSYKHRQSLYTHQKKCNFTQEKEKQITDIIEKKEEEINYKECFYALMNQIKLQGEQTNMIQNALIDLIPKVKNDKQIISKEINGNNNQIAKNIQNITNINQNFNISIFLNENCKDAMNIGDFVKKIEVSVKDLLLTKEKGIVDGLSNLIIKHLKEIPLVQRPLWCSDKKKKKLFIKDECWKEDLDNEKTNEAIYNVSKIQTKNINKYIADKPDWKQNDKMKENYIDIVKKTTDSIDDKKNKIIDKLFDTICFTEEKVIEIKNNN